MTIVRHYMMQAAPGQEEALRGILLTLADNMAAGIEGCLGAELLRDTSNAARFVLIEKWESVDAHGAAVATLPRETGKALRAALAHPLEGAYFEYLK
jgi:quinol monooxygenase YgiN